jgi:hypothetical protein
MVTLAVKGKGETVEGEGEEMLGVHPIVTPKITLTQVSLRKGFRAKSSANKGETMVLGGQTNETGGKPY